MFCKEVLNISDTLYIVIRKIRINDRPITATWKSHLRADNVFKKEPYFYFCERIVDVNPTENNDSELSINSSIT
jgi:hypothetical protein